MDRRTGLWAIHWVDGRNGRLDPPLVGSFAKGIGTFNGNGEHAGLPILIRFLWRSGGGLQRPLWEQAFSSDEGNTWEKNWTMEFHRIGPAAP